MDLSTLFQALLLGILEGFTEFLPVSSTGHILLAGHFLGFASKGNVFEIVIQLGAILAILIVYFQRLWQIFITLPSDPASRRFAIGIVIAFLPAALIGVLAHDFIKTVLFETPLVICVMLIIGGVILLWVDRQAFTPRHHDVAEFPLSLYLKIGLFQCLAMIPGTSRSGATIVGALLMGVSKRAAAEFSFFLAMPTMLGAFTYDIWKNRDLLTMDDAAIIAVGFIAAFISALVVVRALLDFVSRRGYAIFGWWRIIVGTAGLVGLMVFG